MGPVSHINDLNGKNVAVEQGYIVKERIAKEYPQIKIVPFNTSLEALKSVASGVTDAYIANLTIASYLINNNGLSNLKVAAPTPFGSHDQSMGVRKDWPELASIIDKALIAMSDAEESEIRNRWLSIRYEYGVDMKTFWSWIAGLTATFLLVIAVTLVWNRRLKREIIRRVKAEEMVLENTQRLNFHVANSPMAIIEWDSDFIVTRWAGEADNIFGWNQAETIGKPIMDLDMIYEEDIPIVQKTIEKLTDGVTQKVVSANRNYTKDRKIIHCEWYNSVFLNAQGKLVSVLSQVLDVSERKSVEEALLKTRALYSETEKIGNVGGWEFDIETKEQIWTEEVYRIHEVDFTFKPTVDDGINFYTPSSRPIIEQAVQRAIEFGETFDVELDIITAKGNLRNIHAIGRADLEHRRVYGFFQNITERKIADDEFKNNERRMTSLFDISQHPFTNEQEFLDHALNEVIKLANSKIGYIYFYSEQKRQFTLNTWSHDVMKECSVAKPQTIYDLDKTGIWGEAVRQRQPILLNDFQSHNPLKRGVPEGHVILRRFLTVPIFNDGAIVAVVGVANKESDYTDADVMQLTLFMDSVWKIASRKRAEEEKTKLEVQLQHSQKLEAVGQLAGGVAHDFNNMLGVIIGHSELALMKMERSQPAYASLTEILTAAERSAALTRQLLAFARKQAIAPKVIDLNKTVSGMLNMLQRLIGENMHLTWKPAPGLWPVKMDPSQIDQIMANLCVNARDAITDVGMITIETVNSTVDANDSTFLKYIEPGKYVCLMVSDNGSGIDKETVAHIFEPFYTTKELGKGTGLGLATVYGIVKQNNGFINVHSEPGHGTIFTIYLPRYIGENGHTLLRGDVSKLPPRGHGTILLVEDEPAILRMASMMLEGQGYTVLVAEAAAEAIHLSKEHIGKINMLISDVVMPDMNGRDLAKEVLLLNPQIKCLFMSGYTADVIAQHGVLDEGVHFIQKPFSLPDLATKVREVLDGN